MFWESLKSVKDLGRLHEVATVLIRYGFGDLVHRLGMSHVLERAGRVLRWKDVETRAHMDTPELICHAFEELGPCYVKLGQMLGTRVDLFPTSWITEFEKLQDQAPPVSFDKLRPQLEEDLGAPIEVIFPTIDTEPLAAASIAQVHRAQLDDGSEVVLKIRRPNITRTVDADLRLLTKFSEIAENRLPDAKRYQVTQIVRQFSLSLHRELDFASEGRNAERIARTFKNDPTIVIPKVYWKWTCERLNVQQYIDGISGRDLAAIETAGLDRKILAERGSSAVLKMILFEGFFHADPHLGNFFCLSNNRLALIDFGMVGRISDERREQLADLLYAIVSKDIFSIAEVFIDWAGEAPVDYEGLLQEIDTFLDHYHGVPLKHIDFISLLTDLLALMRNHQLKLPPDLAMLLKAFFTLDGVGRKLNPDFDIVEHMTPFLDQVMANRYSPSAIAMRSWRHSKDLVRVLSGLPRDLRRLVGAARRGGLLFNVDLTRLDHFGHQLDKAANRMTIGLVVAAIIVGSSIVMTVEGGSRVMGIPIIGFIGFLSASIGGIWLLISIWRSGRD